jgi:hypothetical protein
VDPKMIFAKKEEVKFLALKCKTTPVPTKVIATDIRGKVIALGDSYYSQALCTLKL